MMAISRRQTRLLSLALKPQAESTLLLPIGVTGANRLLVVVSVDPKTSALDANGARSAALMMDVKVRAITAKDASDAEIVGLTYIIGYGHSTKATCLSAQPRY